MSGGQGSVQRKVVPGVQLDVMELAGFLAWLQTAVQSDEQGLPWPDSPTFRDQTVARWTRMIRGLAARREDVEARIRKAEGSVDQLAGQLRDQTLQLAEQLAAIYELSDRAGHAQTIRLRAAGLSLQGATALAHQRGRQTT